jgi:hypothetical protein
MWGGGLMFKAYEEIEACKDCPAEDILCVEKFSDDCKAFRKRLYCLQIEAVARYIEILKETMDGGRD